MLRDDSNIYDLFICDRDIREDMDNDQPVARESRWSLASDDLR